MLFDKFYFAASPANSVLIKYSQESQLQTVPEISGPLATSACGVNGGFCSQYHSLSAFRILTWLHVPPHCSKHFGAKTLLFVCLQDVHCSQPLSLTVLQCHQHYRKIHHGCSICKCREPEKGKKRPKQNPKHIIHC